MRNTQTQRRAARAISGHGRPWTRILRSTVVQCSCTRRAVRAAAIGRRCTHIRTGSTVGQCLPERVAIALIGAEMSEAAAASVSVSRARRLVVGSRSSSLPWTDLAMARSPALRRTDPPASAEITAGRLIDSLSTWRDQTQQSIRRDRRGRQAGPSEPATDTKKQHCLWDGLGGGGQGVGSGSRADDCRRVSIRQCCQCNLALRKRTPRLVAGRAHRTVQAPPSCLGSLRC